MRKNTERGSVGGKYAKNSPPAKNRRGIPHLVAPSNSCAPTERYTSGKNGSGHGTDKSKRLRPAYVCFGSHADISLCPTDVRLPPKADNRRCDWHSALCQKQTSRFSFEHLVGACLYSALMPAALIIGHHFAISAFCNAPSASGVCSSRPTTTGPICSIRARKVGSAKLFTIAALIPKRRSKLTYGMWAIQLRSPSECRLLR